MARKSRVVVPGYPHHVTQRGNRRQKTFFCDDDYQFYIKLLSEFTKRHDTGIWAYCLMPNHVHLVMVPCKEDGLRAVLAEVHRRYTRRINFREGWRGHLWQERFHSFVMDEKHLLTAVRYVELNPVVARLCQCPVEWRWSSANAHFSGEDDSLVSVAPMLERVNDWAAYLSVDQLNKETVRAIRKHSKTGRPLGDGDFITGLEEITGLELKPKKPGRKPDV